MSKKRIGASLGWLLALAVFLGGTTNISALSTARDNAENGADILWVQRAVVPQERGAQAQREADTQPGRWDRACAVLGNRRAGDLAEDLMVYPGGMPFGVKFMTAGVMVVGFCDLEKDGKKVNPAYEAGLRLHDLIVTVNGSDLTGAEQLTQAVLSSGGKPLTLTYRRDGKDYTAQLTPQYEKAEGHYKTGIWVRDSGAGIGTVTYILPGALAFGGLGHGICDSDTGELIPIQRGTVTDVTVSGIVRGQSGTPGEIKGYFNTGKIGTLVGNTSSGVFGVLSALPSTTIEPSIPAGRREDVKEGKAYILCTLDNNKIERYEVMITAIDKGATSGSKCFTVRVTDPALLTASGGIVQGMSGSPIIQNGKLVGAVTHVLINDPTTGYGVFLQNMLESMPPVLKG